MLVLNGILFLDGKFTQGPGLRLRDGIITEIGDAVSAGPGEEILDAAGEYVLPGFVDVHIHGCRGWDAMQGEQAVRAMSRELAEMGVAAFCPTTMSAGTEDTRKAVAGIRAVMDRPEEKGARVLGAHLEAPFLQGTRAGAQRKEFFRDPDWDSFVRMTGGCEDTVRLITMAPERKGSEAFIGSRHRLCRSGRDDL